jgi:phage tail-like protein
MASPAYPFTSFNFSVEINALPIGGPLAAAEFAECDGLEMTMEMKTIKEGGANDRPVRLAGHVGYSNLTLKRGMTGNYDLWTWFQLSVHNPRLRADADIVLLGADGRSERARFQLTRCLPVRIKAPALNARDGAVAIEEMQLAYEKLTFIPGRAA